MYKKLSIYQYTLATEHCVSKTHVQLEIGMIKVSGFYKLLVKTNVFPLGLASLIFLDNFQSTVHGSRLLNSTFSSKIEYEQAKQTLKQRIH